MGTLGSIIGKAHILRQGKKIPAKRGMPIYPSDSLVTAKKTAVKIKFSDGGTFMAFENSAVKISEYNVKRTGKKLSLKSAFDIAKGKVRFFVKPGKNRVNKATYRTKNAVMGIRGTSGYIDATKPGKTQLIVTTGRVEIANPVNPAQTVMVPANHMSDIEGAAPPKAAQPAPPSLIQNLNRQSRSADQAGSQGDSGSNHPGSGPSEGGDDSEESDDADGQGSRSEGDSSGSEEEGSGTENEGGPDSQGSESESQEETGSTSGDSESQGSEGDGDATAADSGGSNDGSSEGDSTVAGGESNESDSGSDSAGSPESSNSRESQAQGGNQNSDSEGSSAASSEGSDSPGQRGSGPAAGSSPQNADTASDGPSTAGGEPASPTQAPAAPKPVKRVTVFSQDGSSSVAVSDDSLGDLTSTIDTDDFTSVETPTEDPVTPAAVNDLGAAAAEVISEVEEAFDSEQLQEQIDTAVEEAVEQSKTVVEAATKPTKKNVKIKVVLPE